ncbi:MAG: hypothetical protein ACOYXM_10475 [Actinomycetota bacterium]
MIKRILGGAAAAAFAATLLSAGSATAAECTSDTAPSRSGATSVPTTPGGSAYAGGDQNFGYVGLKGNNGWIEASGGMASGGGSLAGNSEPDAVEGKLTVGSNPGLCVNGTTTPL